MTTEKSGTDRAKASLNKLETAKVVETSVLNVVKTKASDLVLKSPDEYKPWHDDPDDLRQIKKAKRRASKQKSNKKQDQLANEDDNG